MAKQIFFNLSVKDLQKSIDFFTRLGFTFDPRFTDQNATCMIIGENIFAMLLVEPFFKTFTKKQIADTAKTIEVMNALSNVRNVAVSYQDFFRLVNGSDFVTDSDKQNFKTLIYRLRNIFLDLNLDPELIRTVHGLGYMLVDEKRHVDEIRHVAMTKLRLLLL